MSLKTCSVFQGLNISTNTVLVQSDILIPPFGVSGPTGVAGVTAFTGLDMYDSGYYWITTGAGVSAGAVYIQIPTLYPGSPSWVTATTPNSATGAAFNLIPALGANATYNGSLGVTGGVFFPVPGIRLAVSGLTGGSITQALLFLTKR